MPTASTTRPAAPRREAPTEEAEAKSRGLGVNRVTLVGRLTADPELRYSESGTAMTRLRMATNDREEPEFHDVMAWGKLAELTASHLTKGRLIYVEGRLHTRSYETRTGAKRSTEVVADTIQFLDGRSQPAS